MAAVTKEDFDTFASEVKARFGSVDTAVNQILEARLQVIEAAVTKVTTAAEAATATLLTAQTQFGGLHQQLTQQQVQHQTLLTQHQSLH